MLPKNGEMVLDRLPNHWRCRLQMSSTALITIKTCQTGIEDVYKGGKFDTSLNTIFEKLEQIGIIVLGKERYSEYMYKKQPMKLMS